jgi:CBS domain-containing protein
LNQQASDTREMTVADLMSKSLHTADPDHTIREAYAAMRVSRIRHLPVLDPSTGKLLGIVSDRDIHLGWSLGPKARVSEVMTRHMQWVHPETPARDAAARMLHNKIGCLPVVDVKERRVVGIVTETDFLEVAHRALTILPALSAPDED